MFYKITYVFAHQSLTVILKMQPVNVHHVKHLEFYQAETVFVQLLVQIVLIKILPHVNVIHAHLLLFYQTINVYVLNYLIVTVKMQPANAQVVKLLELYQQVDNVFAQPHVPTAAELMLIVNVLHAHILMF